MSAGPEPRPVAGGSALPLDTEPLVCFHATLAGTAPPGKIQPVPGPFPFDEEPAVWADIADASG